MEGLPVVIGVPALLIFLLEWYRKGSLRAVWIDIGEGLLSFAIIGALVWGVVLLVQRLQRRRAP